ncbi:histidyl-tRNA synthetase, partial [human gut metagenome]
NLTNKQGGENEKLIFKILKRGEKLNLETAQTDMDVVDNGLRYDLTVPLVRYYSNNANNLPSPFKALQMGMFGELTDHREAVTVSLCSVILIFLETQVTWQKSN